MMSDLAESSSSARDVFAAADSQLGYSLSEICFHGPSERLDATDTAQPAMFVCSVAAMKAMKEAFGDKAPVADMTAGLSLGEYSALYAAGALDFESALDLVSKRGRFMQAAAEARPSGMVSIMGLDEAKILELCAAAADGAVLSPANFNCPGQIVISGDIEACGRAAEIAREFGASGAVRLKVAGAFHSDFMASAAEQLAEVLAGMDIQSPAVPVISNVDAVPHGQAESIKEKLVRQVTSPVRWEQSVRRMLDDGIEQFYEIGPGRVLAGLMRRIDRKVPVKSLNSSDAVTKLADGS